MNDDAFRSWLTGLADGEGCFYIAPKGRTDYSPIGQLKDELVAVREYVPPS